MTTGDKATPTRSCCLCCTGTLKPQIGMKSDTHFAGRDLAPSDAILLVLVPLALEKKAEAYYNLFSE